MGLNVLFVPFPFELLDLNIIYLSYVVCCYSECISHTRQAEKSA